MPSSRDSAPVSGASPVPDVYHTEELIGQMKRFSGDVRGDSEGSEEEAEDLSSEVLPSGLFVIHDAAGSCHHDVAAKERNLS